MSKISSIMAAKLPFTFSVLKISDKWQAWLMLTSFALLVFISSVTKFSTYKPLRLHCVSKKCRQIFWKNFNHVITVQDIQILYAQIFWFFYLSSSLQNMHTDKIKNSKRPAFIYARQNSCFEGGRVDAAVRDHTKPKGHILKPRGKDMLWWDVFKLQKFINGARGL